MVKKSCTSFLDQSQSEVVQYQRNPVILSTRLEFLDQNYQHNRKFACMGFNTEQNWKASEVG